MDYTLELVVLPVADIDRAKAFYLDQAGFDLLVDHSAGEDFRVVQVTPPGSACSVALMRNADAAGSVSGLHLVVRDWEVAQGELSGRGVAVQGPFHYGSTGQADGPDPSGRDYGTFLSFADPDGNSWLVQEVPSRTT